MNQTPSTVQLPFRTRPFFDPLDPSGSQTPLGEPINQISAKLLAEDPVAWHLDYWLNIGEVGTLYGKDSILMRLRVDIEITNTPNRQLKSAICNRWNHYYTANKAETKQYWEQETLESQRAKAYIRDIHRMEARKQLKMKNYLGNAEGLMVNAMRAARLEEARVYFNKLSVVYRKLIEEKNQDAEKTGRFPASLPPADVQSINRLLDAYEGVPSQDP